MVPIFSISLSYAENIKIYQNPRIPLPSMNLNSQTPKISFRFKKYFLEKRSPQQLTKSGTAEEPKNVTSIQIFSK